MSMTLGQVFWTVVRSWIEVLAEVGMGALYVLAQDWGLVQEDMG